MNIRAALCAISFLSCISHIHGMVCFPGENLWRLNNNICSIVTSSSSKSDACCRSIDDELQSIYEVVIDIDASLEALSTSNLDALNSLFSVLLSNLDVAASTIDLVVSDLNVIASQLESLVDAIVPATTAGVCSCVEQSTQSLSALDLLLKSDIDSVSTKVDGVNAQV